MNIPEQAVEAAATALWGTDPTTVGVPAPITRDEWETDTDGYIEGARAALEAALPHIEAALRTQIANDIRTDMNRPELIEMADRYEGYYLGQWSGLGTAARIAEEGTTK